MGLKIKKLIISYYVIVLLLGVVSLFSSVYSKARFSEVYFAETSFITIFAILVPIIILILAIISLVLVIREKLSKLLLIHPIYYISFLVVWLTIIPAFISYSYPIDLSIGLLEKIGKFDFLFYIVDIVLPAIILYKIFKKRVKFS